MEKTKTPNDRIFFNIKKYREMQYEEVKIKTKLADHREKMERLNFQIVEGMEARDLDNIKPEGFKKAIHVKHDFSVTGASKEPKETRCWTDAYGHNDVWQVRCDASRAKKYALLHLNGDPDGPDGEPWHGDGKVPAHFVIKPFVKAIFPKIKE